jgi:hypothetical protein
MFGTLRPKVRFMLVGLAAVTVTLALATNSRVLVSEHGIQPAVSLLLHSSSRVGRVALALLQDPAGILVVLIALLTPIFCSQQVWAIGEFVQMNERNVQSLSLTLAEQAAVDAAANTANAQFGLLGRRSVSLPLFATAGLGALGLYVLIVANGLMASWNSTSLTSSEWRRDVYGGWWANWSRHPSLAVALWCLATYMIYFLFKQLSMGLIFAVFAHKAAKIGFGVTPNLDYNSDGFRGLRTLRRFMLWTYGSSLAHFAAVLCVFVVWLPFSQWTFFVSIAVMTTNALVVIYPSLVAHNSALAAKVTFVDRIYQDTSLTQAEKGEKIEKVWSTPALPFRTRSTLTAVTIYFLVPLILALVSAALKK